MHNRKKIAILPLEISSMFRGKNLLQESVHLIVRYVPYAEIVHIVSTAS